MRTSTYTLASAYNTNIFNGDVVKLVTGGGIELAAVGNRFIGVFAGVKYTDASGNQVFSEYWPADTVATSIEAQVYDDPYIVFAAQSNGSTVAADVGELTNHVAGSGSTVTGRSAHELNASSGTGTAGFRILGKVDSPDNAWGTNVILEVQSYEHELVDHAQSTPGV
jgi:hypothetical protein